MKAQSGDSYAEQRKRAGRSIEAWPEYLRRPLNGRVSGTSEMTNPAPRPAERDVDRGTQDAR
jgi:hypothetical protein